MALRPGEMKLVPTSIETGGEGRVKGADQENCKVILAKPSVGSFRRTARAVSHEETRQG